MYLGYYINRTEQLIYVSESPTENDFLRCVGYRRMHVRYFLHHTEKWDAVRYRDTYLRGWLTIDDVKELVAHAEKGEGFGIYTKQDGKLVYVGSRIVKIPGRTIRIPTSYEIHERTS